MAKYDGKGRIWELDFLRGIALIIMIYYHIIFDLGYLYGYNVNYSSGVNYIIGRISAVLFIFISGISSLHSRNNIKRGLKVLGLAAVISLATYFFTPDFWVKFGILHFLGVCMLLFPVFKELNSCLLLVLGTAVIVLGRFASGIAAPNDYLFIFGIISNNFASSDYYPLMPWLGVFMYGTAAGKIFYTRKRSLFNFTFKSSIINTICEAGKHTLFIYMAHQPVIIAVLALTKKLSS